MLQSLSATALLNASGILVNLHGPQWEVYAVLSQSRLSILFCPQSEFRCSVKHLLPFLGCRYNQLCSKGATSRIQLRCSAFGTWDKSELSHFSLELTGLSLPIGLLPAFPPSQWLLWLFSRRQAASRSVLHSIWLNQPVLYRSWLTWCGVSWCTYVPVIDLACTSTRWESAIIRDAFF